MCNNLKLKMNNLECIIGDLNKKIDSNQNFKHLYDEKLNNLQDSVSSLYENFNDRNKVENYLSKSSM